MDTHTIDVELLDDYADETLERLERLNAGLLEIESGNLQPITLVLRELHTIKGISASLELNDVSHFVHQMEDRLKDASETDAVQDEVQALLDGCDYITKHTQALLDRRELPAIPALSLFVDASVPSQIRERRKHPRLPVVGVPAWVNLKPKTRVVDESAGGVCIAMPVDYHLLPQQQIQIHYQDELKSAIVRWSRCNEDGEYLVGLEWVQ